MPVLTRASLPSSRLADPRHRSNANEEAVRPSLFVRCANSFCHTTTLSLLRGGKPVFEGGWCCSSRCVQARIASALAREMDGRGVAQDRHAHRIPLGLTMLEQGLLEEGDLRAALMAQRTAGAGRLGEWLIRQHKVTEGQVTRALAAQWGCPVLGIEAHQPESLAAWVPRLFVDAFRVLPVRVAANRILYLGFEDRLDPALALAIERMSGLRVESGVVQESFFVPAQQRLLNAEFPQIELVEAGNEAALAAAMARALERHHAADARLVRVHDCFWLRMWLRPPSGPVLERTSIADLIGSIRC